MPQILIVTDSPEETPRTVVYRERIAPSDLESEHFAGQLVERVGWAVEDADRIEQDAPEQGRAEDEVAPPIPTIPAAV